MRGGQGIIADGFAEACHHFRLGSIIAAQSADVGLAGALERSRKAEILERNQLEVLDGSTALGIHLRIARLQIDQTLHHLTFIAIILLVLDTQKFA